nr:DNA recombination protein RmuC [Roseovarius sp.]
MIQIGDTQFSLSDPLVLAALLGAALVLLILILLIMAVRASARSASFAEPLAQQVGQLGLRVQGLSDGQHQLAGGLNHVSVGEAAAQTPLVRVG